MGLDRFWISLRTAAKLPLSRLIVDSPRCDGGSIVSTLRESPFWLTRAAVAGFNESDFAFLIDDEQICLANLVTDFLAAVPKLRTSAPAPGVVEKGLSIFREIVQSLECDRCGYPEPFRLGNLIEQEIASRRPPELAELCFNMGSDHTAEPGLWIWVFLSAEVSENDEQFLEIAQKVGDLLDAVAREVVPDRWPYLYFRSLAEQSEPVEAS